MGTLKHQNPKKAKKERIETLFKKACLLSRIFLHNPGPQGRIALMVEYDSKWQVFLSEEDGEWPIQLEKLSTAEIRYVKDLRTEKEAKEDRIAEEVHAAERHGAQPTSVDTSIYETAMQSPEPAPLSVENPVATTPRTSSSTVSKEHMASSPIVGSNATPPASEEAHQMSPFRSRSRMLLPVVGSSPTRRTPRKDYASRRGACATE